MFNLAEDLMILAIDDEKGKVISSAAIPLDYALVGALIMELSLSGKISIKDDNIFVADNNYPEKPLLNDFLKVIDNEKEDRSVKSIVIRLVNEFKEIEDIIIKSLIEKGVLREENHKILWVFNFVRYPATDDSEEKTLIAHIKEIVLEGKSPDVRTAVLISLLRVCNLIDEIFSKEELESSVERIKEISYSNDVIKAVSQSVFEIQQAILSTITNSGMIPPNSDMLSSKF